MAGQPRPVFIATQPRRCADQETGLTGTCLACGSPPQALCAAPAALRYRPGKARAT